MPASRALRLGLISDTHNAIPRVARAAEQFRVAGIRAVLHAGDITGPGVLRLLADFDLWVAWGNADSDGRFAEIGLADEFGAGHFARLHSLLFDDCKVALLHGDNVPQLLELIHSGEYDYVIHGHTHQLRDERVGRTRIVNPGALGGADLHPKTFAILDLATGALQVFEV